MFILSGYYIVKVIPIDNAINEYSFAKIKLTAYGNVWHVYYGIWLRVRMLWNVKLYQMQKVTLWHVAFLGNEMSLACGL